ncbi:MAG TPA: hypothetical protein VJP02_09060 [Candidatus Sulfotelmatobacter sp.]|nr:hypothetical protein [Candidatus Sulfotelmatobacter sp.]
MIATIIEGLVQAEVVIADVTDRNANVFYELGVRHALRRGTILVSQGTDHVPSDLRGYWFLTYGLRPAEVAKFKTDIKRIVASFEEQPDRSDSPVSDYLEREQLSSSRQVNRDNVKKLSALLTELSGNRLALRQYMSTHQPQVFSVGCLELLIQTLYVDVGPDVLKLCYELEYKLHLLQKDIYPEEVVSEAFEQSETLGQKIGEIKNKITKGEFIEPASVSNMVWSPRETMAAGKNFCSPIYDGISETPAGEWQEDNHTYSGMSRVCALCGSVSAPCPACAGTGRDCALCSGSGFQSCVQCGLPGRRTG